MSLRVWLPLNKDLRNNGLENVTVTNNSATFSDSCYSFNASAQQYIQYTGFDATSLPELTIACWVKPTNTTLDGVFSVSRENTWQFGIANVTIDDIIVNCLIVRDNSIGLRGPYKAYPIGEIEVGKWIHICCSYNKGNVKIYKNGVLYSENLVGGTALNDRGDQGWLNNYWVGKSGVSSNYFSGSIYDFRIYDHALSIKEVKELAKGLYLHYTFDDPYIEPTINLVTSITKGGQTTVSNNIVTTSGVNSDTYFTLNLSESIVVGTQYTISCETDLPEGTFWTFPIGGQSNTSLSWVLRRGYNSYTFTANNFEYGSNRCFIDDTRYSSGLRGSGSYNFWNFLLEKKDHATPYTPNTRSTTIITDNSGFSNDGIINGSLQVLSGSARGNYCTKFSGTSSDYIFNNLNNSNLKSASFWCYIGASNPTSQIVFMHRESKMSFGFHETNKVILVNNNGGVANCYYDISSTKKNAWNHFVVVFTDSSYDLYLNGIKLLNPTGQNWGNNANGLCIGNRSPQSGYTAYPFNGQISDFRMYTTILLEQDIQNLYKDSFIIDDTQKSYCYELNETDSTSQVKFNETGIAKCKSFSESLTSVFDDTEYIEPDGSVWIKIFHHNNPSDINNKFSVSDSFTTNVYKGVNSWFNVAICNKVNKWEFLVKEKATSSSTEQKLRWIQNVNPMVATYAQTTAANVTKVSGYDNISSYGGLLKYSNTSNTYLAINNGTQGNWMGAIGFFRDTVYEGGMPAFGNVCTTGYVDLYLRIDNLTEIMDTKISENGSLIANEIIEL